MTEEQAGKKSFIKKLGDILVYVFHPAFLFFYFFLLAIIYKPYPFPHLWKVITFVLVLTIIIPASVPFLYARDNFLKDRRHRSLPLLVTIVCYTIGYIIIRQYWFPYELPVNLEGHHLDPDPFSWVNTFENELFSGFLLKLLVSLILGLIMIFIINRSYKISLHANGIGFLLSVIFILVKEYFTEIGVYIFISSLICLLIIFISYLVLWQRLYSKSHTLDQIISGFLLGFTGTALIMSFWPNTWL